MCQPLPPSRTPLNWSLEPRASWQRQGTIIEMLLGKAGDV